MVCTCERLMVPFAHVPGSGGESCREAGPESGAVVDCLFSLRLLEKAQQLLRVCRLFLFKESKLPRLLRSLKGCRKAHSPSQDFLSSFSGSCLQDEFIQGHRGERKFLTMQPEAVWGLSDPFRESEVDTIFKVMRRQHSPFTGQHSGCFQRPRGSR